MHKLLFFSTCHSKSKNKHAILMLFKTGVHTTGPPGPSGDKGDKGDRGTFESRALKMLHLFYSFSLL